LSGISASSEGRGSGLRFVSSSSLCPTSPPAWRNSIFTGPTPRTHQTVRTPLPYGSPIAPPWVISERTFAATMPCGKAPTTTRSRPA
jgi:hypothetical protein